MPVICLPRFSEPSSPEIEIQRNFPDVAVVAHQLLRFLGDSYA